MTVNELRVGNYLQDQNGNLLNICEISKTGYSAEVVDRSKFPLPNGWQAQPIPLTEEWLVRLGFEFIKCGQDVNSGPFCHWDYWVINRKITLRGKGNRFGFSGEVALTIISVHQLQNLYFALTGQELVVDNS